MSDALSTPLPTRQYWDERARRYAGGGWGRAAVCSFGMPSYYNLAIELSQRLAMRPWLRDTGPDTSVLDLGCGIGRWARRLARRGAIVHGVDLSGDMVGVARERTAAAGLADRCTFEQGDLPTLDLGRSFDRIVCVTVLQHITDNDRRASAVRRMRDHLADGGRAILLEAAPSEAWSGSDHHEFRPLTHAQHLDLFESAGLRVHRVGGVDATFVRKHVVPKYRTLGGPLGPAVLALSTLATLPFDLLAARRLPGWCWHKVYVLGRG